MSKEPVLSVNLSRRRSVVCTVNILTTIVKTNGLTPRTNGPRRINTRQNGGYEANFFVLGFFAKGKLWVYEVKGKGEGKGKGGSCKDLRMADTAENLIVIYNVIFARARAVF